jgi:hypothetical protein
MKVYLVWETIIHEETTLKYVCASREIALKVCKSLTCEGITTDPNLYLTYIEEWEVENGKNKKR